MSTSMLIEQVEACRSTVDLCVTMLYLLAVFEKSVSTLVLRDHNACSVIMVLCYKALNRSY